jgi:hypothetical protein
MRCSTALPCRQVNTGRGATGGKDRELFPVGQQMRPHHPASGKIYKKIDGISPPSSFLLWIRRGEESGTGLGQVLSSIYSLINLIYWPADPGNFFKVKLKKAGF